MSYIIEEGKNLEVFALVIWTIWFRQNQIRTSNHNYPSHQIVPNAIIDLNDFLQLLPSTPTSLPICKPNRVTWPSPSSHFLKVYFDGAVFKDEGEASIRAVIQNENGLIIVSVLDKIMLPQSVDEVEGWLKCESSTLC